MEREYFLQRQAGGVLHLARVRVAAAPADSARVRISPSAGMWTVQVYGPDAATNVPTELEEAAESGAMLALAQARGRFTVTVTTIAFNVADTTPDDVKFAAAHAVWRAIGHAPASPPYIDENGVHFPATAGG
jgi:hypothetical protein